MPAWLEVLGLLWFGGFVGFCFGFFTAGLCRMAKEADDAL
jgi:hypothetical protein